MFVLAVALGAAPSIFLLVFFYLKDRYEPEPRGHVALAFVKGALATVPIYYAQRALAAPLADLVVDVGPLAARAYEAGVMAAGVEELAKWLVFLLLIYRWDEFDEPLDGVVYGVALALGFATIENVLKVVHSDLATGVLRAVFAVPAHALFGAVMGFYFGRAKLGDGREGGRDVTTGQRVGRVALALAVPVLFHALYDFSLVELHGPTMYGVITLVSVGLWLFVLRRVHRAQGDSPFKEA